jgi:hypothetical protein
MATFARRPPLLPWLFLAAYADLAATTGATILGDPAELMARWARVELLAALERSEALHAEATALDADLRNGRWTLDRTTALTYAQALKRWRSDAAEASLATQVALSEAVATLWTEWHAGSPGQLPSIDILTSANVQGSPDLVVEILSPGTRRTDETTKRKRYETFGV